MGVDMEMEGKNMLMFNEDAVNPLLKGMEGLYDAVSSTLGPKGRSVVIYKEGKPIITKDGATVAHEIAFDEPSENCGAMILKQAAERTAEEAGDGTTTATMLGYMMAVKGMEAIRNGNDACRVVDEMGVAVERAIESLRSHAIRIEGDTDEGIGKLRRVALISSNGDEEIASLIVDVVKSVGIHGSITLSGALGDHSHYEVVKGMRLSRGFASRGFVTDRMMDSVVLDDCNVIISRVPMEYETEVIGKLNKYKINITNGENYCIIAPRFTSEVIDMFTLNKRQKKLGLCLIQAPGWGKSQMDVLDDVESFTGAMHCSIGNYVDEFLSVGKVDRMDSGVESSSLIGGKGVDGRSHVEYVDRLRKLRDNPDIDSLERKILDERIAQMCGGVGVIYVGAPTEIEAKEKKDRFEDSLYAVKAAINEGILPGGGVALYNSSFEIGDGCIGSSIVSSVMKEPYATMYGLSGLESGVKSGVGFHPCIKEYWKGINFRNMKEVNMYDEGIIDPLKVERIALENAFSVARTILLSNCLYINNSKNEFSYGL